jgi:Pvc16 N-terminal domain
MASSSVIRDVTETLRALLEAKMTTPSLEITVSAPPHVKLTADHLLNLFLYQVIESPFTKNQPAIAQGPSELQRSPLCLNLYYLVTPYVVDTEGSTVDEHLILGDAMRVLFDHPLLFGPTLRGDLAGTETEIKVGLSRMNLEEHTRIWHALQIPYRLSACYEVKLAAIDSEMRQTTVRVATQETRYGGT